MMGDFRSKEGGEATSRASDQSVDTQFLEDLQRATRLSLESFKTEQETRVTGKRVNADRQRLSGSNGNNDFTRDRVRELEITSRPRPSSSRPISTASSQDSSENRNSCTSDNGGILSPSSDSPLNSIPPPCPFKRHRSLPYRRHLTHPPIVGSHDTREGAEDEVKGSHLPSDDLILLASPLVTPKFQFNHRTTSHCDTIYASPVDDISPTNLTKLPMFQQTNSGKKSVCWPQLPGRCGLGRDSSTQHPSPSFSQPLRSPLTMSQLRPTAGLSYPVLQGGTPTQGTGTTSTVIGGIINNLAKSNSSISLGKRNFNNGVGSSPSPTSSQYSFKNLYKRVSEELQEMNTGDLIDFGSCHNLDVIKETGSRNILEYFDPLVIRAAEEETKREKEKELSEAKKIEAVEEVYNASVMSCVSTATSGFTYKPTGSASGSGSLSLYPSLEEFEYESLYGTLNGSIRRVNGATSPDASSFYDVYNPFEYLYTVSCSSPLATASTSESAQKLHAFAENGIKGLGFAYPDISKGGPPIGGSLASQIAPALPPRNSIATASNTASPTCSTSSRIQLRIRSISHDKSKRSGKLYENIENIKNIVSTDSEIQAFYEMIREIRFSCRHVDSTTNKGYIRSPILENKCTEPGHSLKIVVWSESFNGDSATFTSDGEEIFFKFCSSRGEAQRRDLKKFSTGVELVLEQSILELEIDGSGRDFLLRVKGLNEYLDGEIPLANYVYVQQCIKLDQDVQLVVVQRASLLKNSWARTGKDDGKSVNIEINDILPEVQARTINYNDISIPLEVIDRESDRIKERVNSHLYGGSPSGSKDGMSIGHLSPAPLMQPVKAVCVLLKEVVTIEIVMSLNHFAKACDEWNSRVRVASPSPHDSPRNSFDPNESSRRRAKIIGDIGTNYSLVEVIPTNRRNSLDESLKDVVFNAMDRVTDSVRNLVEMYSKSFPVSFRMKETSDRARIETKDEIKPMGETIEPFIIRVGAVHRLKLEWLTTYVNYSLSAEVYHGTRWMGKSSTSVSSVTKVDGHWFFNTVVFDAWLCFEHLPICILPRESRVVLTLHGRKPSDDNNNIFEVIELGWASMQCFNFKGLLAQGNYLLPFWQVGLVQKRLGPAPNSSFSSDGNSPLLTVEFNDFRQDMYFPEIPSALPIPRDFVTLDTNTRLLLTDIFENSTFTKFPPEDFEVLWEKRHYLHNFPQALPKVLLSAQLWDWASIAELHAMLQHWKRLDPVDALELLLPCFPDVHVREKGVLWISNMVDEDLMNLLPQLVEALCYETFDLSPLAKFLLKKSLSSIPFSHSLFWMLASQIGLGKWVSEEAHCDPVISRIPRVEAEGSTYDPKRRRLELMLNSLMIICGEKWRSALISQYKMIENLSDIAIQVKATSKDSARLHVLWTELQRMSANIFPDSTSFPLPTAASSHVRSVHPNQKMCSYYNSNATPLKVSFLNGLPEGGCISTIFKVGDDLRQDMLTLQTIRLIEKWWLKEGLDLRVLTFSCVPTGHKQGMVEMVPNAETLCKIQAEYGVTGVFRDSAISDWLAKMNPSTLDYRRAIDNFTLSCAAYCVLTYVLGICDRHNDNIMLTKKGHLFHIDFGKFLGDAQMFIKFKRDRTPFVLTSDMIYVINDGEKGSLRFHRFVELCCRAFKIIRKNGNILLNLFALMVTAGIPGVDLSSVTYIQKALLPDCSNVEAAAQFTRFIEESSQNWFTPVNFFLHSLAQLRFSSDTTDNPTTLSFVPTIYRMEQEGRIEEATVISYQKKYDPEKYYSYTIKITRKGQCDSTILHRSYKEFLELRSKLCINFPKADGSMKALARGAGIGRSNVKQVAEKRRLYIQSFLDSLWTLADEIGHSNLIYTFFHPILRDEEQHMDEEQEKKISARASLLKDPSRIHGQIKLSLEYQRGALLVLILHAVDLACPNGQPPSPYVKTYLRPDIKRLTKRKTRVVRRSKHPSFMEMIEYRLPLDMIRQRVLQISVWHHDSLQENSFLGGVSIPLAQAPLDKETTETYTLTNITTVF